GDVLMGGRRVTDAPPRDRNLAMVFQNYALYPHLSVFENIAFPLRVRGGVSAAELRRRVEETAALLELTEHLGRRPSQLSGGQRQRVAMGRAIVRRPFSSTSRCRTSMPSSAARCGSNSCGSSTGSARPRST